MSQKLYFVSSIEFDYQSQSNSMKLPFDSVRLPTYAGILSPSISLLSMLFLNLKHGTSVRAHCAIQPVGQGKGEGVPTTRDTDCGLE